MVFIVGHEWKQDSLSKQCSPFWLPFWGLVAYWQSYLLRGSIWLLRWQMLFPFSDWSPLTWLCTTISSERHEINDCSTHDLLRWQSRCCEGQIPHCCCCLVVTRIVDLKSGSAIFRPVQCQSLMCFVGWNSWRIFSWNHVSKTDFSLFLRNYSSFFSLSSLSCCWPEMTAFFWQWQESFRNFFFFSSTHSAFWCATLTEFASAIIDNRITRAGIGPFRWRYLALRAKRCTLFWCD